MNDVETLQQAQEVAQLFERPRAPAPIQIRDERRSADRGEVHVIAADVHGLGRVTRLDDEARQHREVDRVSAHAAADFCWVSTP